MSDRFHPPSLSHLLNWILGDLEERNIFHIPEDLFFNPGQHPEFQMQRFDQLLESPIGVAAGPHTQLAANIIASWLCGARYMELKTVQTLDELEISKPCIDMPDEGYNCEWSQELKVRDSYDEYLKAWILIHILRQRFGWDTSSSNGPGVIFNMSVGYDMEGILKPNVQEFFDLMENGQDRLTVLLKEIEHLYPAVGDLDISTRMSDNITLSTMHGCPPDEIEKIASYLIQDRHLHTAVKLNPTLLGPTALRQVLHADLGHEHIRVPDEAFEHDLKYGDAVGMIQRLRSLAVDEGVVFSLKLTNTLEVENQRSVFPAEEKMSYLSGRVLHPISIRVAEKLQREFDGELDLSFCAGADAFNVSDVLAAGLGPVTTCTDLLKPGGYTRLHQYFQNHSSAMKSVSAAGLDTFILKRSGIGDNVQQAAFHNLKEYSAGITGENAYRQHQLPFEDIKTDRELGEFDCIHAPCIDSCTAGQDIPGYIYHTAQGDFKAAYETILDTNAMPGVTGYVCDHLCMLKCTRNNYDQPVQIREIKRFASVHEEQRAQVGVQKEKDWRVAVIGAGPAGLSAAYFLARDGCHVEVFEARENAGGMTSLALPTFRLPDEVIHLDYEITRKLGVEFHFGEKVSTRRFRQLRNDFDSIFLGIGAQGSRRLGIPGEDLPQVLDPLEFLSRVKTGEAFELGDRVAIIGGGNTAMDAARTARRMAHPNAEIVILYRRSRREMPADQDEIREAQAEGVLLIEQVMPLEAIAEDGKLTALRCCQVELGEPDADGRRRPVPIPDTEHMEAASTIIPAVGQVLELDFLPDKNLEVDAVTGETTLDNVFAGGDAVRGAASIVDAIGDGHRAARSIMGYKGPFTGHTEKDLSLRDFRIQAAKREIIPLLPGEHFELGSEEEAIQEARRCLYCDDFCSVCVGVCPNMANITYLSEPRSFTIHTISRKNGELEIQASGELNIEQNSQVLNIADLCNECGNCTTFCPTSGDPYLDKPRFHLSRTSYVESESGYHLTEKALILKEADMEYKLEFVPRGYRFECETGSCILDKSTHEVLEVTLSSENSVIETSRAARMTMLYESLMKIPDFRSNT